MPLHAGRIVKECHGFEYGERVVTTRDLFTRFLVVEQRAAIGSPLPPVAVYRLAYDGEVSGPKRTHLATGSAGYSPPLGSPAERAAFLVLQAKLPTHFQRFALDPRQPYTAVVVPSLSVDPEELGKIAGSTHYEERQLFNLMLLRHPRLHVIFLSSKRLNPLIVDYYLHQMRGVPPSHARRRLTLLDCDDASARPLALKLLERPRLLKRLRDGITDPEAAHLVVFNSTALERSLAVQLGIPLYACDPELTRWGSKTGSRRAFRRAGVGMAPGREGLRDLLDLAEGLAETWEQAPTTTRAVVKLNDSFSGEGNALLDLRRIAEVAPGRASHRDRVRQLARALPDMRFEASATCWDLYAEKFIEMGGVCEAWIEGPGKVSPSAQVRISPLGDVVPISTHDQLLGGPSGQVYQGATFPAASRYRKLIQQQACRVGEVLRDEGVIGRFGVDFLVLPSPDADEVYAVEINLRQGGTTHPFNTLKFLTDGRYDPHTGTFLTSQGRTRCYVATDVLQRPEYVGILPFDLIELLVVEGIHFRANETGVVFHLLGCLSEYGKLGCTAIGRDLVEAHSLYDEAVGLLDRLAGR
ncbi:MAG: ATP-grasp domain-containing protein [Oligoflexia bacterium]|nr:ATP-grasp domain-containing protein [Oligoflexia bacterium]